MKLVSFVTEGRPAYGIALDAPMTDMMVTPGPRLIAYVSTILPLLPDDVIVSGTPGGAGSKRKPPSWMKSGDMVDVEISGIGVLRNPVIAEE